MAISKIKQALADKCLKRWYTLKTHTIQQSVINDKIRFKCISASRRSGKSEICKRIIVREALRVVGNYFVCAPTRDQVKRIYWECLKLLSFCPVMGDKSHSESELRITFPNGSTISLVGLDVPQRIEGIAWAGGLLDEYADIKAEAWNLNVSPALDTFNPLNPDYRAWAILLGCPDGRNHWWEMCERARTSGSPDWKHYTWPSADILPPEVIEAAKLRMSASQFRQEYEASFETAEGRIYAEYGDKNVTNEAIKPTDQLMWMHDFNFSPMSSAVGVRRGDSLYIMDEIILQSAVSRQSAEEFVDRYRAHQNKKVIIYGDPAGKAGEKHSHASDFTEMETVLRAAGWTVDRRVKAAAPAIRDRQNAVRAKIKNASGEISLYVNPIKCPYAHKGLSTVTFKEGSTFIENQTEWQHITTGIGYCIDWEWPINAKPKVESFTPIATINRW